MMQPDEMQSLRDLRFLAVAEPLFDTVADLVFFVKDREARYVAVNDTLVRRLGMETKDELIGKTTLELFAAPLGRAYHEQDLRVLENDEPIEKQLELHLYLQGGPGWCITSKLPLHDAPGRVIGLAGISNDIHATADRDSGYDELARAIDYIRQHIEEPLRIDALAEICGLSVYQFEERMKRAFHLTVGQFISKTRINAARGLLSRDDMPIAEVAFACGFSDQSAFTRQFKLTTGLTPSEYRRES